MFLAVLGHYGESTVGDFSRFCASSLRSVVQMVFPSYFSAGAPEVQLVYDQSLFSLKT